MTSTITRTGDSATTTPHSIDGYATEYENTTIVHRPVDGGVALTLAPHLPRSGTLNLFYADKAEAWQAIAFLASTPESVDTFTLANPDVPEVDMLFAALTVSPAQHDSIRGLWLVPVEYQEIPT